MSEHYSTKSFLGHRLYELELGFWHSSKRNRAKVGISVDPFTGLWRAWAAGVYSTYCADEKTARRQVVTKLKQAREALKYLVF